MASVGNKGKFSDRLKRMKLIRYAKKMNIKIEDGFLLDNNDSKIEIGSKKINISVDNGYFVNITSKKNQFLNEDIVDNSKLDVQNKNIGIDSVSNIEVKEKSSEFIKRKAVENAGVGAAIVGTIGANLLDNSFKNSSVENYINNNIDSEKFQLENVLINNEIQPSKGIFVDKINEQNISLEKVRDSTGSFIMRKAVETAGVSAAIVGVISSNLLDSGLQKKDIKDKNIYNLDNKSYLAAQIIKKIRREFESNLNQIEVLESELYLLNDKNENELDLERCNEIKKQIKELISKINHIIEQYNIYQYNRFLDDMLDIDDSTLVDDISNFKRLYDGIEIQEQLKTDYELICEYQLLYSKLDNIKNNVEDVQKKNDDKIISYEKRDMKYESIKNNIIDIEEFKKNCDYYIKKQNEYVDDIKEKISKIDIDYAMHYRLKGFGNLVGGTLRYLGLLMVSPFSSLLPGIGYRTYVANRMVNELKNSLRLEKVTTTIYKVEDFQFQLNDKINDLNYNYYSVDKTLDNIKKLKSEFMEQYNYSIPGYDKTLIDINEIENLVYNNREKIDIIRVKLKENKKLNEDTLKKVKVLEKESKPLIERV